MWGNQAAHASVAGVLPGPRFWGDIVDACELLVGHRVDNPLYDPGRGPIATAVSVGCLWAMWPSLRTNPALPHTFWHSPSCAQHLSTR